MLLGAMAEAAGWRLVARGRADVWRLMPVVLGALWGSLAAWSGGILASLAGHMLWTRLMLALPPGAGRGV